MNEMNEIRSVHGIDAVYSCVKIGLFVFIFRNSSWFVFDFALLSFQVLLVPFMGFLTERFPDSNFWREVYGYRMVVELTTVLLLVLFSQFFAVGA
jgi:hypothetical protein